MQRPQDRKGVVDSYCHLFLREPNLAPLLAGGACLLQVFPIDHAEVVRDWMALLKGRGQTALRLLRGILE